MHLKDFDYELPKELIAQHPLPERDASRLMVLDRATGDIEHTTFQKLPACLSAGDLLVANDTRVIPARIYGRKQTGGWVELFLLGLQERPAADTQVWECLLKSRRKIEAGAVIAFSETLAGRVLERTDRDTWQVALQHSGDFDEALQAAGQTPLPPYIKRDRSSADEPRDRARYQTVYAAKQGAVAAPTAGLHFTLPLMDAVRQTGAEFAFVTLHVGLGTFQPVREEDIRRHKIHEEFFEVDPAAAGRISRARRERRRVISVGTTATRVLETLGLSEGGVCSGSGYTDLYIYPGFTFRVVDALVTNFHLPRSSLLMLAAAFAGTRTILKAYQAAVKEKYRFFSYGDAMLIL